MKRAKIPATDLTCAIATVRDRIHKLNFKRKGAIWVTPQEALGVLTGEYHEYVEAVHQKDYDAEIHELLDIATAAIFALASYPQMERFTK